MQTHHPLLLSVFFVCAAGGALAAAESSSQAAASTASAQASSPVTLTGCVEYGPRGYVLATMDVPAHPDLSNEPALEREELTAAEHSYQLIPEKGEQFSQLVGARVRADGTVRRVSIPASTAAGRGAPGRGQAATATISDQLNASSVQKLGEYCGAQLTMFAM